MVALSAIDFDFLKSDILAAEVGLVGTGIVDSDALEDTTNADSVNLIGIVVSDVI